MREIFESSFSLIIVAIVVAVRFVFYLRKRAAERDKRASQAGQSGYKPLESIKAIEAEGSDDEGFSAWNLAVTDEETVPPSLGSSQSVFAGAPASTAAAYAAPLTANEAPSVWETIPQAVLPTYAPTPGTEPEPPNRGSEARQSEVVRAGPAAAEGIPAGSRFWTRYRSLPPMQQGVLMAEILGSPKGF
jgi:hypothetical protein